MTLRLSLAVLALCAGCATARTGLTDQQIDDGFADAARRRAAFDLDCPREEIATTNLGDTVGVGAWVSDRVIGVSGCDKRAVYVSRCSFSTPDGVVLTAHSCIAFLDASERRDEQRAHPPVVER